MKRDDVYKKTTDAIVQLLKEGTDPFNLPWKIMAPHNAESRHIYTGGNAFLLGLLAMLAGYDSAAWYTFSQAKKSGFPVPKGEKAGGAILVPMTIYLDADGDKVSKKEWLSLPKDDRSTRTIFKGKAVWNANQVGSFNGVLKAPDTLEADQGFCQAIGDIPGLNISFGGNQAYTVGKGDGCRIMLPSYEQWDSEADLYATLFHEATHWTAGSGRYERQCYTDYHQSETARAEEELIAEIGSAFLCSMAGIEGKMQHASYVQSWLHALDNDHSMVYRAATQAQKAVEVLLDLAGYESNPLSDVA